MLWSDNSTLLNHEHVLLNVNVIHDDAIFFTNNEMEEQGKGNIDVQTLVERLHVYIPARCGSSEVKLLIYINTRKATSNNELPTSSGTDVTDVTRLYHAYGPKQDFESGEQKEGNAGG